MTFGNGGKNAQGEHVPGFGYYEVRWRQFFRESGRLTICRRSLEEVAQDLLGREHRVRCSSLPLVSEARLIASTTYAGVHTHMTNTRASDPEIFERRYPTILHQMSLREGSGGVGLHNGGNGIVRVRPTSRSFLSTFADFSPRRKSSSSSPSTHFSLRFPLTTPPHRSIQCSILSERRVYQPYGLHGGGAAQCGRNLWIKQPRVEDGDYPSTTGENAPAPRTINLGGKATVKMGTGDRIGESFALFWDRRD